MGRQLSIFAGVVDDATVLVFIELPPVSGVDPQPTEVQAMAIAAMVEVRRMNRRAVQRGEII
ncbi:hypothetical protein [Nocardia implantans]|uniref:Uncharacterized protein n=1 Tax=Nocardia implantans TaxID=3108168 RepID=A0ABU6ATM5_9NOCA|nr:MULTISPECIES: hypothetical protein [unclassified Nocardia]MEA3529175.1 hypothetical protein [Nocardia sp. CDC192]MEB3510840.1 hypothetical protein [Nocardia sp. CDC186]